MPTAADHARLRERVLLLAAGLRAVILGPDDARLCSLQSIIVHDTIVVVFDAADQQGQPSCQVQHFPVLGEAEAPGLKTNALLQQMAASAPRRESPLAITCGYSASGVAGRTH
jgi:hypothetical protein